MTTSATARRRCSPPSTSSTAPSSAAACSATGTRSSSASSTPSRHRSRPARSSTSSSTTTPPQAAEGDCLARPPPPLYLPLHPDLMLLAQRRRDLLRHAHQAALEARRLPVVDLQTAINRYLDEANHDPKPFIWTADPDKIIAAVNRGRQALESIRPARHTRGGARVRGRSQVEVR